MFVYYTSIIHPFVLQLDKDIFKVSFCKKLWSYFLCRIGCGFWERLYWYINTGLAQYLHIDLVWVLKGIMVRSSFSFTVWISKDLFFFVMIILSGSVSFNKTGKLALESKYDKKNTSIIMESISVQELKQNSHLATENKCVYF